MKFKVGDRVKILSDSIPYTSNVGKVGTIVRIRVGITVDCPYVVQGDGLINQLSSVRDGACFMESEIEKVEEPMTAMEASVMVNNEFTFYPSPVDSWSKQILLNAMYNYCAKQKEPMSITPVAKSLLDSDTQLLIEMGYLDSELDLTSKGSDALEALNFTAHKAELIALATAEKEKK